MSAISSPDPFASFRQLLAGASVLSDLRGGLIGEGRDIATPFGPRKLVYADYTASGRALRQVEGFVMEEVLPFYANSHTEASHCGAAMTGLRRAARAEIARLTGAGPDHAVIFTGSGATAGINRLVALMRVGPGARVVLGPHEHHSNILPWRESGAEIVTLPEGPAGGPDAGALSAALGFEGPVVCAFSAASNVTGDLADVAGLTRIAKSAGARVVWDYAGGGPYLPIAMGESDAVVLSPHKFIGGPGASGLTILRRDAVRRATPSWPGGGTVRFVSPEGHDYSDSIEAREEAGTPNVVGDIRAALALMVKEALMAAAPAGWMAELTALAEARLGAAPGVVLLGARGRARLPVFSFRLRDGQGGFVHQQLVTRMLSDHYGIQARGGCACAGPYVHQLLGLDAVESARIRAAIRAGRETEKPGFTRFNLSVTMDRAKVDYILDSIADLAGRAGDLAPAYACDPATAIYRPASAA